jgi:hypothetical protein
MADKTENQVPNNPTLTETIHEAEVREQFRRTEADRARMAAAAAQGARSYPTWKVGEPAWSGWGSTSSDLFGSMADETENQVPNIPNLT